MTLTLDHDERLTIRDAHGAIVAEQVLGAPGMWRLEDEQYAGWQFDRMQISSMYAYPDRRARSEAGDPDQSELL